MYKNLGGSSRLGRDLLVSILVLMELCIKTDEIYSHWAEYRSFNPCFNGTMYKNNLSLRTNIYNIPFQSLF